MSEQVESTLVKKQSRRKGALNGQLEPHQKPHQKAQQSISSTLGRLDEMQARFQTGGAATASPVAESVAALPDTAGVVTSSAERPATRAAETSELKASGIAVRITSLAQLRELIEAIPSDKDKLFAKVPMQLIKPSEDNHRRFALSFKQFKENMPAPPENWRELTPEDYVEQYWQPILEKLVAEGEIHPRGLEKELYRLRKSFSFALSAETETQIHPTNGYLKFDTSGQPDFIEICSGEQRYRGYLMVGNPDITMDFKSDAAVVGSTPELKMSRAMSRAAENIHNTGVSPAEVLEALAAAYQNLIDVRGYEQVVAMTNAELMKAFQGGFDFPRATRARYLQIIKHPQSTLLIDLCDWFDISVRVLSEVASKSTKLAEAYGRDADSVTAADVYAAAYTIAEVKRLTETDIPSDLCDVVFRVVKEEALLAEASPGTALAERAMELAIDQPLENATEEPALADDAGDGAAVTLDRPQRQRYLKSEAGGILQKRMGWSVNKGPSWRTAHRHLFTQTLEQVLMKEYPNKPSPERFMQLRELARIKDVPEEIDTFRVMLLEILMDYSISFEAVNKRFINTLDLLDELEASDNAFEAYTAHISEKCKALMGSK